MKHLIEYIEQNLLGKPLIKIDTRYPDFHKELIMATSNMPEDTSISERIWNVVNGFDKNKCIICGNSTKWKNFKSGYRKYCSSKCSNSDDTKKSKIKETMLQKYGVEHALRSKIFLDKSKNTLFENYGVDSPLKNPTIKTKLRKTNLSKYGAEEWLSIQSVREQISETFLEKYGYRSASSSNVIKEKTKQTCLSRYGTAFPANASNFRALRGYDRGQEQLYHSGALSILNDKARLQEMYDSGMSLTDISEKLNCSDVTVGKYFKHHGLTLRDCTSSAQLKLFNFISEIYDGPIIINDRNALSGKEIDIYLPKLKFGIEYCGVFWHSDKFLDKNYHKEKFDIAQRNGIRLVTIFEDEWKYKAEIVENKIRHILGNQSSNKIYARNTTAKFAEDLQAVKEFVNANHIQGYVNASKHIALYDNTQNNIVAIASLKVKSSNIEITRYCTSNRVVGGFSKLLSAIEKYAKELNIHSITTFADLRWSIGELYEKTGFTELYKLPPDYRYVVGDKTYHKFNFRHSRLCKMQGYNEALSENENTKNMNIYRIYDCGKIKYGRQI